MLRLLVVVFLPLVATLNASAQQTDPVGLRVRVWATGSDAPLIGRLASASEDSLVLSADTSMRRVTSIARSNVVRLDIARGTRSRRDVVARSATIGIVIGAAVGFVGGYVSSPPETTDAFFSPSLLGAVIAVPTALLGGIIGTGLGISAPLERWRTHWSRQPS